MVGAEADEGEVMSKIRGRNSREYAIWNTMMQRCYNPKVEAFKNYGARGIDVCERWHQYANFFEDMGSPGEGMSLDRIDNDAGYSPENCRWATAVQQAANQRKTWRGGYWRVKPGGVSMHAVDPDWDDTL